MFIIYIYFLYFILCLYLYLFIFIYIYYLNLYYLFAGNSVFKLKANCLLKSCPRKLPRLKANKLIGLLL